MRRLCLVLLTATALPALAQCVCDFTVAATTGLVTFDGATSNVLPGQTVCLTGGTSGPVSLRNLHGTLAQPITVRACGARIIAGASAQGLDVVGDEHVRITGAPDAITITGFSRGIYVRGGTSDLELDHLEVADAGFTGIDVRTAPQCDGGFTREVFTMNGLRIRDNVFHDCGSAMYLGELACTGGIACGAVRVNPHQIFGVDVHDNQLLRCNRTALKIACSPDALVHHNVVLGYGVADENAENNGLETREGSVVQLFSNYIDTGTGHGVFVKSESNTVVQNNVIVNAGAFGIGLTGRTTADVGYRFLHNTIVSPGSTAIAAFTGVGEGKALNNLIVVADAGSLGLGGSWQRAGNLVVATIAAAGFEGTRFELAAGSVAIDVGVDAGVSDDFLGNPRDPFPDVGALERVGMVITDAGTTVTDGGVGQDAGQPDAGAAELDAGSPTDAGMIGEPEPPVGCGCTSGEGVLLLAVVALLRRNRCARTNDALQRLAAASAASTSRSVA